MEEISRWTMNVCSEFLGVAGFMLTLFYVFVDGYPPTINSYPECNEVVSKAAARFVGNERSRLPQKTMGAEDFSYFLQERPGKTIL